MNVKDLIGIVPELMLLFVPGYIALRIDEVYSSKKRHANYDTTVYALFYSALIGIIYCIIKWAIKGIFPGIWQTIPKNEYAKQLVFFCIAIIFGYIRVKMPQWPLIEWIEKQYNEKLVPYETVWEKSMENNDVGAWATVHLNNGIVYFGVLSNYSTNPDSDIREIMLTECVRGVKKDVKSITQGETDIIEVAGPYDKVLLNAKDIISVEITRGKKEVEN